MEQIKFMDSSIEGLRIIKPFYQEDDRGFFLKPYEEGNYKNIGNEFRVTESFETFSRYGTIRGMHFQTLKPQAKIVRVILGEVYDVAIDLRKKSDTFGKWQAFNLSEKNRKVVSIPAGFAHGFMVLSEEAIVSYMCDGKYLNEYDTGIRWNDEMLAITWPMVDENVLKISYKDSNLMSFEEFVSKYEGL